MRCLSKAVSGKVGENVAAHFLKKNGFNLLKRNFHSRYGEIDMIAAKDELVVFVEVKYRKNNAFGPPCVAVNFKKQNKLKKAALHFIGENDIVNKDFRFDIIEITGKDELELNHIENAFC